MSKKNVYKTFYFLKRFSPVLAPKTFASFLCVVFYFFNSI